MVAVIIDSSRPTTASVREYRQDDHQGLQVQRHIRQQEHRQAVRQLAHVADGADVQVQRDHDAVSTTMVTSGEGTALVSSGSRR
jgi:hypothetical protein